MEESIWTWDSFTRPFKPLWTKYSSTVYRCIWYIMIYDINLYWINIMFLMFQCDFSWPRHQMVIFAVVVHLMISSILVTFHIMFHSCPHGCTSPPFNRWLIIIMSSWLIGFLCCWVDLLNSVQSAFLLLHSLLLYLLHLSTLLFNHPNDGHIFNQQTQSEKVVLIDPW